MSRGGALRPREPFVSHGDVVCVTALLRSRSRAFAARIEADRGAQGEGADTGGASRRWTELGHTFAFDWGSYRCVHGFGDEGLRQLGALLEWFASGPAPTFETYCGGALATAAQALIEMGYAPAHAHALYAGQLGGEVSGEETGEEEAGPDEHRRDEAMELSADPELFAWLGAQLWDAGDPARVEALARQHAGLGWTCVSALEGGRPVAAASMFFDGATAYLANAITAPGSRGRGLHARLLRARIQDARACGKRWVVADTQVGSGSGRNLERAGLHCVATCLGWRPHAGWGGAALRASPAATASKPR